MNNYYEINFETNKNNNLNNKPKFITKETPGCWIEPENKGGQTLLPKLNNLKKNQTNKVDFHYPITNLSAGRGFGNLNISNDMRYGDASRSDTKIHKEQLEAKQFFDYQFQYLDKNVQDPKHLVMSIPRGGESTRKQNQLEVNTMRNSNINLKPILDTKPKPDKIIFKY